MDDISLIAASPWPCKSFLTWSERTLRLWRLEESVLKEVNEQHHLGILRSVANTTLARTNELIYQLVTVHSLH